MNQDILNHINKGQVVAIIPARSGSKGVKNKNIRCLNGYPMIAYSIAAAKLTKNIDRVVVSTDSAEYAEIARKYGAETPFLRPAEISGDEATDFEFMQHAIEWFYENEGSVPEYWVHLRVTCPLRDPAVIEQGIEKIKAHPEATCLLSVNKVENFLTAYKWLIKDGEEYVKSIFFENNDDANLPRKSYPDTYIPTVYVDVLTSGCIVKNGVLHGNKMVCYETEETVDIDTEDDFERASEKMGLVAKTIISYINERSEKTC
ncbi:MAG: acylneuraminate cytidylyltransferase family protein [Lachnospiraceae bacterium]|nr:acylneuraminate cytidylyltransferase family protein [Lachnospiraceae bacterium]MBQ8261276.1 acylneuraminate cytidylyltransferase family protein [Lachnospiraceae bacterium]MBQ8263086.1 acylneuraminate cytidylyltransferase family protein [Lachnospiraceae bacterium]